MELIEDPVGQDKSHLPSSIPPRIESEIPASENDFIPTHLPANSQRDNRRLEAGGEGSGRGGGRGICSLAWQQAGKFLHLAFLDIQFAFKTALPRRWTHAEHPLLLILLQIGAFCFLIDFTIRLVLCLQTLCVPHNSIFYTLNQSQVSRKSQAALRRKQLRLLLRDSFP